MPGVPLHSPCPKVDGTRSADCPFSLSWAFCDAHARLAEAMPHARRIQEMYISVKIEEKMDFEEALRLLPFEFQTASSHRNVFVQPLLEIPNQVV